jgi:hypothetical protein
LTEEGDSPPRRQGRQGKEKLYRQDAKGAKENKSFTAKGIIIRSKATPEGREETALRVAYRKRCW